MRKRVSENDIIKFVEDKGFVFIDFINYCGAKSIIKVICPNNHAPYVVSYSTITRGDRASCGCPTCKRMKKSKTTQDRVMFKTIKQNIEKYGYEIISKEQDYKGVSNPITIQCPNKHQFQITFREFNKRKENGTKTINKCEFCFKEERINKVKEKCKKLNYILLTTEYIGKNQKLDIICDKGHEWHPTFDNFINKDRRCRKCVDIQNGINQKLPWSNIVSFFNKENYNILSKEKEYINNQSKLKVSCPLGHKYEVSYSNFHKGTRWPFCASSKGEERIKNILDLHKISFESQFKFKDCKFYKYLPFDFYLPDYNCCIEFDGKQHYEIVEYFGGYETFINTKIRDTVKNVYCKENNIYLLRIPYWEFDNIENILRNELNLK